MRQVVVPAVVAVILSMSALGCSGEDGKTKLPGTGGCTFNSKLPLDVWVVRERGRSSEVIGKTPSAKPVVIPRCASWGVSADPSEDRVDMRALAREIASKEIAGLGLGDVEDEGLAHLKGLTELRELTLWETKITDAGVDSLSKALPEADISN